MALIDEVKSICDRLSNAGWQDLLRQQGIEITQPTTDALSNELTKKVDVKLTLPGFEDFSRQRARGIEPGNPAASLLYHAFAAPGVHTFPNHATGQPVTLFNRSVTAFPTIAELDTLENYIFACANRSIDDVLKHTSNLLSIAEDAIELKVAVFASEYRPAPETPHKRYADLCFSRTGVARVGTSRPIYDGQLRGYIPYRDDDGPNTLRVLPCRYTTWLAVLTVAKEDRFGPARKKRADAKRNFWVPVHKLFDGTECIAGLDLVVHLNAWHENRKIERLHERLEATGHRTGYATDDRQKSPFVRTHLADWLEIHRGGSGLLGPAPQPLSDRANFENRHLTFETPQMLSGQADFGDAFSPTLTLSAPANDVRPWPEYAHVRYEVQGSNALYFGDKPEARKRATEGGYSALNLSDPTADGWIRAEVTGIDGIQSVPAYSLLAAPDFFPAVDQSEVFEWWTDMPSRATLRTRPQWLRDLIGDGYWNFWREKPEPLSDTRFAPNINLTGARFDSTDVTVTSVITALQPIDLKRNKPVAARTRRHAVLPDAAAGIFAPGWDISADRIGSSPDRRHFASYGLGSPFPEDAKLCAALSTYWPAAAPDTARTFFAVPFSAGTVCPLTDEENGAQPGSISWDGLRGPSILSEDSRKSTVRYPSYGFADYSLSALEGRFSIAATSRIDFKAYTSRILAMLRIYRSFGLKNGTEKKRLHVLSFRELQFKDKLLRAAQDNTGVTLQCPVYRFDVFWDDKVKKLRTNDVIEEAYEVSEIITLVVGSSEFVLRRARFGDGSQTMGAWQKLDF